VKILVLHDEPEEGDGPDEVVEDVATALEHDGHEVQRHGLETDVPALAQSLLAAQPDLVFNLTESFAGRSALDSGVASLLNLLGLRYTGSSEAGLLLAGDKALAKKILVFHGIITPEFATLQRGALETVGDLKFPLIVKPPQEDASIGITSDSVVRDLNELLTRMDAVQREHGAFVMVEQFIEGRELYVGVLGNEKAEALPIAELDMSELPEDAPRIASFAAKWHESHPEYQGTRMHFPEDLPEELATRIQAVAVESFQALRMSDYARIDMRVTDAGEIHVLEVNPNCYLRKGETFAASAERAGTDYDALIARIVELAGGRYAR
jgi:D-alanine-D-alanine ligase